MIAPEPAISAITKAGGRFAERLARDARLASRVWRWGPAIEQVSSAKA